MTHNAQLRNFFSDRAGSENIPAIPGNTNSNSSLLTPNLNPSLTTSQPLFGTPQLVAPQTVGLPNTFNRDLYSNSSTPASGSNTNAIGTIPTVNLNNSNLFNSGLNANVNSGVNSTPNLNPNLNPNNNLNGYGYPYNAPGAVSNPYGTNPYTINPYSAVPGGSTLSGSSVNTTPTSGLPSGSTAIGTPPISSPYTPDASFTNPLAPPTNPNLQNTRTLPPGQYIGNGQINTFANP